MINKYTKTKEAKTQEYNDTYTVHKKIKEINTQTHTHTHTHTHKEHIKNLPRNKTSAVGLGCVFGGWVVGRSVNSVAGQFRCSLKRRARKPGLELGLEDRVF